MSASPWASPTRPAFSISKAALRRASPPMPAAAPLIEWASRPAPSRSASCAQPFQNLNAPRRIFEKYVYNMGDHLRIAHEPVVEGLPVENRRRRGHRGSGRPRPGR